MSVIAMQKRRVQLRRAFIGAALIAAAAKQSRAKSEPLGASEAEQFKAWVHRETAAIGDIYKQLPETARKQMLEILDESYAQTIRGASGDFARLFLGELRKLLLRELK